MLWPRTTSRSSSGELTIGGVSLVDLAREYGTPLYIFDETSLRERAQRVRNAFRSAYPRSRVVYAGKAYGGPAVIRIFREEGLGLDVASGGELYAGLRAGMPPSLITFHGNNKGRAELAEAVAAGVGHVALDNDLEIANLQAIAAAAGKTVGVLLRLNPGIDVHTHTKIATGVVDSKFGFPVWEGSAERAVQTVLASPNLVLEGYHAHIGSQLFDAEGYRLAIDVLLDFAGAMKRAHGVAPKVFSPGGGFGIPYTEEMTEPNLQVWADMCATAIVEGCQRNDLPQPELIVEPGRSLVGPAGVALYTVGARKEIPGVRTYVAVDGGMADNIRPSLYEARYTAAIANRDGGDERETVTISGKYCESGDILITDISLPPLRTDDLLALPGAGAYCLAMASNYNMSTRPAVVIVRDGKATLARRRETYADLLACDVLPG
jgi:diaminopimelate decarboxylase